MPRFRIPNSATIHNVRSFLRQNRPFEGSDREAVLELHPKWVHVEPVALAMAAAWGAWAQREGMNVQVENLGRQAGYAARMKLFECLGIDHETGFNARDESGRFLPLTQVSRSSQVAAVIGSVSALLQLNDDPESLAAVQYCVSELLRNVIEHSGSPDGAFICAHRYTNSKPHRVTIAVADCGQGIARHLGRTHPEAMANDVLALGLAMRPGITGARAGLYGTPDNAGAGLFITRSIAKGCGGYFFLHSGEAGYRLRRARTDDEMVELFSDPFDEPRSDVWTLDSAWPGTVVSVEIRTDQIADYDGFFRWIFSRIPGKSTRKEMIRFT